jgi:hypothetical protein
MRLGPGPSPTRLISATSTLIRLQSKLSLVLDFSAPSRSSRPHSFFIARVPESEMRSSSRCNAKIPGLLLRTSSMCAFCFKPLPVFGSSRVEVIKEPICFGTTSRSACDEIAWVFIHAMRMCLVHDIELSGIIHRESELLHVGELVSLTILHRIDIVVTVMLTSGGQR